MALTANITGEANPPPPVTPVRGPTTLTSPTAALTDDTRGRPPHSLHYSVGEISGKLDQLLINLLPRLTSLEQADQVLEGRVDGLEKWQARLLGGGAVLVSLFTGFEVIRYVLQF